MIKTLALGLAVAVAATLLAQPARAAVTAALATPTPPPLTFCGYTLTIKGTISGPVGTNLSYYFGRFNIPGPPHTATTPGSIPQGGTLNVSDSIQVTKALANGTTYQEQLYVLPPYNVYSNTVSFKPTCSSIPLGPQNSGPPAPTNLSGTADRNVCAYYVPPIFCNAGLVSGYLAFIFKWSPGNGFNSLDGYKLYRVTGGGRTYVTQSSATEANKALFATNYAGQCFVVTAYQGSNESGPSNTYCPPAGTGPKHVVLSNPQYNWHDEHKSGTLGFGFLPGGLDSPPVNTCNGICVGYTHWFRGDDFSGQYDNYYFRSALRYNIDPLHATTILHATLHMHVSGGTTPACISDIAPATSQWFVSSDNLPADFGNGVVAGQPGGADPSYDVTYIVRDWVEGHQSELGFVLRNSNENNDAHTDDSCLTNFAANPTLELTYN